MEEKTVALVQESFSKILPIADAAVDIFYGDLFELDPSLREIFPASEEAMKSQKNKLRDMLAAAVAGLKDLDRLVPILQNLGKRHVDYQVKPEHYETVGAALISALTKGLGDDFTPEVKDAWLEVYGVMSSVMIEAAETV